EEHLERGDEHPVIGCNRGAEARKPPIDLRDDVTERRTRRLQPVETTRELPERARDEDDRHRATAQRRAALRAASTRGGDMGNVWSRAPVARAIAAPIAAGGGTIETSPTPRTPYGCPGFGTSTITVSIIGRSFATGMR